MRALKPYGIMPYKLSTAAFDDLEQLSFRGLLDFGPRQSERYQSALLNLFELIGDMPGMGRRTHDENSRRFAYNTHVIFYSVEAEVVVIERIIDGRRLT